MRWIYAAAVAALAVLLLLPGQTLFRGTFGRADALSAADAVEELVGPAVRVVFFEVDPHCLCSAFLDGAATLDEYLGKEWVVRGYRGGGMLYELRFDANFGFSSLRLNLSLAGSAAALSVAARVLRSLEGGAYEVEESGGQLAVTAWRPVREACRAMVAESSQWRGVAGFAWAAMQAILLSGLLLAAALATPGVRKGRLALLSLPLLLALGASSTASQLQYLLGKNSLAPTLRSLLQLIYYSALLAVAELISLVAGAALLAKSGAVTVPRGRVAASSWLEGVAAGVVLSAVFGAAYAALARWRLVAPLQLPALESALTAQLPWLSATLHAAASTVLNAAVYRFLLLLMLREVVRGVGQAVVLSSAVYALSFIGYALYPPAAGFVGALLLSAALSLLYLWRGLFAAAAAEYTYNALAYALSIRMMLPLDALLVALTPLQVLPVVALAAELARRFAS